MKRLLSILLPLLVLVVGLSAKHLLVATGPKAEMQEAKIHLPLVEVQPLTATDHVLKVQAFGEVAAQSIATLTARASGELLELSPKLLPGAFFAADEVLARLDDQDARDNLALAEGRLAQAQAALALEEAQAEAAREDWARFGEGEAPAVVLREPQLASARAAIAAAEAQLAMAQTNLERTVLRAPFAGRCLERIAERGQWVGPGTPLARIYPTAVAEVRLPLSEQDLKLLGIGADDALEDTPVTLHHGEEQWTATLTRVEAGVDRGTRLIEGIVVVEAPYQGKGSHNLVPGMFLGAEIQGRSLHGVFLVPSSALIDRGHLRVVDSERRVHQREIHLVHDDGAWAVIDRGLASGEQVLLTPLTVFVEGMEVKLAGAESAR